MLDITLNCRKWAGSNTRVHLLAGQEPAFFMRELSIFIDESGDFGIYDPASPYYLFSLVFHEQQNDISTELEKLERQLSIIGFPKHCIHAGPIVRSEEEYRFLSVQERQKILLKLMVFIRRIDFNFSVVSTEKKHIEDEVSLSAELSKRLGFFLMEHLEWLRSFDVIKIYYDNGQTRLTSLIVSCFSIIFGDMVKFRKVQPIDYRLFQVADLICTISLAKKKMEMKNWSQSERNFFGNQKIFKNKYLDALKNKELK